MFPNCAQLERVMIRIFTMIPMVDDFRQRFTLGNDFVVVADSGQMNKNNVALLRKADYKYILGAHFKSGSTGIRR